MNTERGTRKNLFMKMVMSPEAQSVFLTTGSLTRRVRCRLPSPPLHVPPLSSHCGHWKPMESSPPS